MSTEDADGSPPRRRRGRPAQIGLDAIVAAARTVDADTLTMQAVADVLGVDRKALNYYVHDRDSLLQLVALDVFDTELARIELVPGDDWRDVLRSFATALRDATVTVGPRSRHLRLPASSGLGTLAHVEHLLQSLLDAGFAVDVAARALAIVTDLAFTAGYDAILVAGNQGRSDIPDLERALQDAPESVLPALRRVVSAGVTRDSDSQLEFNLELIVAGLETKLGPS